ncbi:hypothetical protein ACFUPZ_18500 [Microbacterium oxydans]|uniref:hypothetical protein n=1 Tax=Microbacterium oxydans TaxID=82380 RepID=UPI00363D25F7
MIQRVTYEEHVRRLFEGLGGLYSEEHTLSDHRTVSAVYSLTFGGLPKTEAYAAFVEACQMLEGTPNGDALINALGGGQFRGEPLADRRRAFARKVGITERSLYRREASAIPELISHSMREGGQRMTFIRALREQQKDSVRAWDLAQEVFARVAANDEQLLQRLTSEGEAILKEKGIVLD